MVLADKNKVGRLRQRDSESSPFGGMNRRTVGRAAAPPPNSHNRPNADFRKGRVREKNEMKALKMQRALAEIPYTRRARIKQGLQEVENFNQFDILPAMQRAIKEDVLQGMEDIKPSAIQKLGIPALLNQSIGPFSRAKSDGLQSFLLAAETGSGKTLAYAVPCLNAIKKMELEDERIISWRRRRDQAKKLEANPKHRGPKFDEPHPYMARPRVVILVPTAELASQVGRVVKSLSHEVKLMTDVISADLNAKIIHRNVFSPRGIDVLTATPHLLLSIAQSDPNIMSRVSHLIIDEADSLFDRSFAPITYDIIDRVKPSLKQLILCSATIPKRLDRIMNERFPEIFRLTTPNLHAIPRRIQMGVVDVSKTPYQNNKLLACHDALWAIAREASEVEGEKGQMLVRKVMVFVNERDSTQKVADYLNSKGVDAVALHRDTEEARQAKALSIFTENDRKVIPKPSGVQKRGLQNIQVLVATDIAARGIDTLGVKHVILYDVPHSTIDFIHRLGRAGRFGRRGRAIILVDKNDRKDVVAEVRESMFLGHALI